MFQVIPVLDLRDGGVVHARHGDRERYAPLRSTLCDGSDPVAVVGGILGLFPFRTLYIADLDAIEGTGDNGAALARLTTAFPQVRFWLDAGFREPEESGGTDAVLGSESLATVEPLARMMASPVWDRVVLSLDFRGGFVGPPDLLDRTDLWPRRIIAMTLRRVGSGAGPDWDRLAMLRRSAPDTDLFAAGGARDGDDLRDLAARGCAGALVATALHDGRIDRDVLEALVR